MSRLRIALGERRLLLFSASGISGNPLCHANSLVPSAYARPGLFVSIGKLPFRHILPAWLLSRALLLTIIVFSHSTALNTIPAREERNLHPELRLSLNNAREAMRCVFSSADASWYFGIAEQGYDPGPFTRSEPKNWTFFPLFPFSISVLNIVIGSSVVSGLLFANLSFLLSLFVLHAIGRKQNLEPHSLSLLPWLVCFFPTSYFFSAPLTESLFLLCTSLAWYSVFSGRILSAGLLMALASATRPTGLLVLPAFFYLLWQQRSLLSPRGVLAAGIAPSGAALYMWYLYRLTGEPLAFAKNQFAWNRGEIDFFTFLANTTGDLLHVLEPWNPIWLNLAAVILAFTAGFAFAFRKEFGLALFLLVPIGTALLTGTALSAARFVGGLFPVYFYLLSISKTEISERIMLGVFVSLFSIFSLMYALHVTAAMT